ncbi:MAG: DUF1311 domain-containing protein [Leptospiraceae bacterium]|nr:DUF1311 domain-containing protein [Leptospiraceae bacterium]
MKKLISSFIQNIKRSSPLSLWPVLAMGMLLIGNLSVPAGLQARRSRCAALMRDDLKRTCYENEFQERERERERYYERIFRELTEADKLAFRDDMVMWKDHRDYMCEWSASLENDAAKPEETVAYHECRLSMTDERIAYIRRAFGREGVGAGRAGLYEDGYGGRLELKALPTTEGEELYSYDLTVVRGPTAHLGEIHGRVQWKAATVESNSCDWDETEAEDTTESEDTHVDTREAMDDHINSDANDTETESTDDHMDEAEESEDSDESMTDCCTLTFQLAPYIIKLEESDGCQMFHGARAYFDGTYRKVN